MSRPEIRDLPSKPTIACIAVVLVALHNAEEAFALRTYLPRIPDLLREPFAGIAHAMSYPAMLAALAIATLVMAMMALAPVVRPQSRLAGWWLLTLQALMGINAVAHAASALFVFGGYAPGLVTALLFNVPFAAFCFRLARRDRWLGGAALLSTVPAALVLHGPVLQAGLWLAGRVGAAVP